VACPMCHSNLDFRQSAMLERGEKPLPVLYLSELVGLALGLAPDTLGLQRHFVDARPLAARAAAEVR
jgi:heterodisulfide reductase subunit B